MTLTALPIELAPSIDDLPDELLLSIFHGAYLNSRGADGSSWDPSYDNLNISADTLFPFNLILASARFEAMLSTTPEYWTHPIIYIDSDPTESLEWLSRSSNLVLDVVVKRRAFAGVAYDLAEKGRLRQVMNQINAHLPRIKSLRVYSLHSSSLPSLVLDFGGGADILTTLELHSELDDCDTPFFLGQGRTFDELHDLTLNTRSKSPFTKLEILSINGRNFDELCYPTSNGDHIPYLFTVKKLALSNYTFRNGNGTAWNLSFTDMLVATSFAIMNPLVSLALRNIHFDDLGLEDHCRGCNGNFLTGITDLILEDVDPGIMAMYKSDMVCTPRLTWPES